MKLPIYLDNHATTPLDQRVIDAMLPYFTDKFGNVASTHCFGRDVRQAVKTARQQVADLIGADADEIIFTSGATESNNLAIKGIAEGCSSQGKHIITSVTEHKSVLDTCMYLESKGFAVTYLPVDQYGMMAPAQVEGAVRRGAVGTVDRTVLISVMGANNEVGTVHPIEEIAKVAASNKIILHVDAVQMAGKLPIFAHTWGIDLLSLSAHKMYGPKGVGALYVRRKTTCLPLVAQIHGGKQELGLRSGTLPVPLVVGLGVACDISNEEVDDGCAKTTALRERLWAGLQSIANIRLNGHPTRRLPGNLHVTFKDLDGELLMLGLKDIAVSSTSACSSASPEPSHVLKALGVKPEDALSSIRFGLGRFNTEAEVDYVIAKVVECCQKLRLRSKAARAQMIIPASRRACNPG